MQHISRKIIIPNLKRNQMMYFYVSKKYLSFILAIYFKKITESCEGGDINTSNDICTNIY